MDNDDATLTQLTMDALYVPNVPNLLESFGRAHPNKEIVDPTLTKCRILNELAQYVKESVDNFEPCLPRDRTERQDVSRLHAHTLIPFNAITLVREPNTESCDPKRHIVLIDVALPIAQKSYMDDDFPYRSKARVDMLDPMNINFRMLKLAEERANDRIEIEEPNDDSLKHDAQFEEPNPSTPLIEYRRLDSRAKLRSEILELTSSVFKKLVRPQGLQVLRMLRQLPIAK
jgi:hypothetical protein